jgi:hypothetical protein
VRIFEFDIDSGQILVEDQWYTAEALSHIIQEKLSKGDFKISVFSEALERLVAVMESAREVRVVVTKDVADSFERIGAARQMPVEKVVREVLMNYLTSEEATNILFGGQVALGGAGAGSPTVQVPALSQQVIDLQKKKGD